MMWTMGWGQRVCSHFLFFYTTKGGAATFGTAPLSLPILNSIDNIELHRYYFLNLRKSDILNRKRRISSFIVHNITIYAT